APTDSHSIPIHTQPSLSKPQKTKSRRKQRKDSGLTEPIPDEAINEEHTTKSNQALEIKSLKRRVKSLEKRRKSRTSGFKRLRKVSSVSMVKSSNDVSLGAQEDASKQGRKINDLDVDAEVSLVDETQEMNDDNLMFDTDVLEEKEKEVAEKEVSVVDPVTNVEVTTANSPTTTINELTLAQTLIEIKVAKPKVVTSAATTTTTTRPKARGVVVQEPTELEEEERISRLKEEKANIALLELWDNTQAIIDANFQLAQQMQTEEQEHLSIKEKSTLFVELLENRKKHFAALRAQEKRIKPPTKVQKINTMSTYLKNMAGYKHNQLKSKSYDEIQEMFDKEMKRVNTFVDINTAFVKSSKTRTEGSSKRAGDELGSDNSKKQKIDKHVEAKKDDDQEEAEMKKHIEIVKDDEVAIDAIPLATKPLMLPNINREDLETLWKLVKAKHGNTRPKDEYERVLWGDMKNTISTQDLLVKEKMESQSETTQIVSALKLPVLKTEDYDLWSMRMKKYLTHTDYALWEVIVNGDAPAITSASAGTEGSIPPKTAEQKLVRKNELKAKSTLLLAIPDEHLLKFYGINDAKTL
ncbi:hypothetical protein Tco_1555492, partial [Tanacetum coccineum]